MKIRRARLEDSAGLAKVQVDSYQTAYAGIFPKAYLDHFTYEDQEKDWREMLSSDMEDLLLVAESGDGVIAGYALGSSGLTEFAPYDGELRAIHVQQEHQRHGVGRQLIRAMAAEFKRSGCRAMLLWVLEDNPARRFYEQLGGRLIGRKTITLGDAYDFSTQELAYGWPNIDSLARLSLERPRS